MELKEVAELYTHSNVYVARRILQYRNINLRTRSEIKHKLDQKYKLTSFNNRKYKVNHNYFDIWTHNMAYILGFIASDGYVGDNYFAIGLKSDDTEILEKIKKELNFTGEIKEKIIHSTQTNKDYKATVLYITSKYIVNRLKN